jgi:DNA (cytosine-5)-methyltransferase 1
VPGAATNVIDDPDALIADLGLGTGYGSWRARAGTAFGEGWQRAPSGLLLPPDVSRAKLLYGPKPICVDLFAGAGGFGLGFTQAGWNVIAAVDNDPFCAMTYLYNLAATDCVMHFGSTRDETEWWKTLRGDRKRDAKHPFVMGGNNIGWAKDGQPPTGCQHYWLVDIRKVTGAEILAALGLERGDIDCVTGGPPCQGFSTAGMRNVMDPRNSLVFEFARVVVELQPRAFIMENVPAMLTMRTPQGRLVIEELADVFEAGGWERRQALNAIVGPDGILPNQGVAYGPRHPKRSRSNGVAHDVDAEPSQDELEQAYETRAQRTKREKKAARAAEAAEKAAAQKALF